MEEKKLKLINTTNKGYELNWLGFDLQVYMWITNNKDARWLNGGDGNHLFVSKNIIGDFVRLMREKNYKIDNNIIEACNEDNTDIVPQSDEFHFRWYQVEDAKRMFMMKKVINASEMGTGKTAVAILAASMQPHNVLIICPSSVIFCWYFEVKKINKDINIIIFDKNTNTNIESGWLIISYEQYRINYESLSFKYGCLIVDEAHYIKAVDDFGRSKSKRAQVCIEAALKSEYVFLISGTPMPSYTKDIYNLLVAIGANDITFNNWMKFGYRYCAPKKIYFGKKSVTSFLGGSNLSELNEKMSKYMIRRKKSEVLPDLIKQRQNIPIRIKKTKEMDPDIDNFFGTIMRSRLAIAQGKMKTTIDFVKNILEQNKKVVIVSCFLSVVKGISKALENSVVLTGEMSQKERIKSIELFQSGDADAMVISLTAGGVGITLTAASTIIFNDVSFVPAEMQQAEDRICRIGQKDDYCNVYYLTAANCMLDELTQKIINKKLTNIARVIEGEDIKNEIYREYVKNANSPKLRKNNK